MGVVTGKLRCLVKTCVQPTVFKLTDCSPATAHLLCHVTNETFLIFLICCYRAWGIKPTCHAVHQWPIASEEEVTFIDIFDLLPKLCEHSFLYLVLFRILPDDH